MGPYWLNIDPFTIAKSRGFGSAQTIRLKWNQYIIKKVAPRFELGNGSFAGFCLTTWLCHRLKGELYTIVSCHVKRFPKKFSDCHKFLYLSYPFNRRNLLSCPCPIFLSLLTARAILMIRARARKTPLHSWWYTSWGFGSAQTILLKWNRQKKTLKSESSMMIVKKSD